MIEYDFINVLRLDSCFRFLSLGDRIHLHRCNMSPEYFANLSRAKQKELAALSMALQTIQWEVPGFHRLRENEAAERYWACEIDGMEVSEAVYARIFQEKFEVFSQKRKEILQCLQKETKTLQSFIDCAK